MRNWKEHLYVILWYLLKRFACLSEWITCAKFCAFFAYSWHCEISTYQCREQKYIKHGEQRCRWGVFAVNSCDDQEKEAHEANFEECPVTARLNLNVSWYISITKQKILQRGSRSNTADSSLSPCRSSLLPSCLQTGSEQGGSSHGFKTFLMWQCYLSSPARPAAMHNTNKIRVQKMCARQNTCSFSLCSPE